MLLPDTQAPAAALEAVILAAKKVQDLLSGAQKYAASQPREARQQLLAACGCVESLSCLAKAMLSGPTPIVCYFTAGTKLADLTALQADIGHQLSSILSGSVALARTTKEALATARTELLAWQPVPELEARGQAAGALQSLYNDAVNEAKALETVEVEVDAIVRRVVQQTHGGISRLSQAELLGEVQGLEAGVRRNPGPHGLGIVLSLVLNSLRRMNPAHLSGPDEISSGSEADRVMGLEDEEIVEDDEDDLMFSMPVPSHAFKLADEKKFTTLAAPITPEPAAGDRPMLTLDGDSAAPSLVGERPSGMSGPGALTPPAAPQVARKLSSASSAASAASLTGARPTRRVSPPSSAQQRIGPPSSPGSRRGAPSPAPSPRPPSSMYGGARRQSSRSPASASPPTSADSAAATPRAVTQPVVVSAVPVVPAALPAAPPPVPEVTPASQPPGRAPGDEKDAQLTSFLTGQNPQACMFHAQMKLSVEGCQQLANFLAGSQRVRALSLSHNRLGDDGMAIICTGLRVNTSVTSIDLPDNNISDAATHMLAEAVKANPSLTQLQLSNNRIGDAGAIALAELIRNNQSLKKLGLAHNNIGQQGCQALAAAIKGNKSLQQLQLLPGNPIDEKDAKSLSKALSSSKKFSIRELLRL